MSKEYTNRATKVFLTTCLGIAIILTPMLVSMNDSNTGIKAVAEIEQTTAPTETTIIIIEETQPTENLLEVTLPTPEVALSAIEKTKIKAQFEGERTEEIKSKDYNGQVSVTFSGTTSSVTDNEDGTVTVTVHINGSVKYTPSCPNKYRLFLECILYSATDPSVTYKKIIEVDKANFNVANISFTNLVPDEYSFQGYCAFGTKEYLADIGR